MGQELCDLACTGIEYIALEEIYLYSTTLYKWDTKAWHHARYTEPSGRLASAGTFMTPLPCTVHTTPSKVSDTASGRFTARKSEHIEEF